MIPKISVIVPIYNAEAYLRECIDSVINQTLKEIEVILVNDGSTDQSLKICNEYVEKDSRVKVFSNANVGQGLERNFGIKKSNGKYISFIDSDDIYEPSYLENLYLVAENENAEMVSCGYSDIFEGKVVKRHLLEDKTLESAYEIHQFMADLISYKDIDGYKGSIAIWDSLFRKDIIEKYNIQFFSERKVYSEDLLFKLDYMEHCNKIVLCSESLYLYRITNTSFTNNISVQIVDRITFLHELIMNHFQDVLNDFDLKQRITNRTFFTLRFNIKKSIQSKNSKEFYRYIYENKKINQILKDYKSIGIKNCLIKILLNIKHLELLRVILKNS